MNHVEITWPAPTVAFDQVCLRRRDSGGDTWHAVAVVEGDGINVFRDYEAPYSGGSEYRLWGLHDDGAAVPLPFTLTAHVDHGWTLS